jgi:hypothetical protein
VTRSIRTRLRRAIGLALALGVVIAPNALAKPSIADSSGGVAARASQSAGTIATTHDTWGRDVRASRVAIAPLPCTPQCATTLATSNGGGSVGTTAHDSWGSDVRSAVTKQAGVTPTSGSHETRDVLLAASGIGLLLIGGGSLVLMLRRRRAQLA